MMPNQKNIMIRFSFIILIMVLVGIAIICKAGVIMFAERQYYPWQHHLIRRPADGEQPPRI